MVLRLYNRPPVYSHGLCREEFVFTLRVYLYPPPITITLSSPAQYMLFCVLLAFSVTLVGVCK